MVPRQFGNAKQVYDQHGYCEGVEYAALHSQLVKKPILFVGLPITTPGAVSRVNKSGNTGTSVPTVTAGGSGVLAEHEGIVAVETGGTIGTDQIMLAVSLDGGRSFKKVRLGTANSYTPPYFGVSITFAAGTLVAGETILTWFGSAPRSDAGSMATARANLAAQLRGFRSVLHIGDLQNSTEANALLTQLNAYETQNERFIFGRASVLDRQPQASSSRIRVRMTGTPTATFTTTTLTRSSGDFIADGFVANDIISITGAATGGNNLAGTALTSLTSTALTFPAATFTAEGPTAGVTVIGSPRLVFAATNVTRSRGSFLTDGFRIGDTITVTGTVSNNGTKVLTNVPDLALTWAAGGVAETIASYGVSITAGQTKAAWMAAITTAFAAIDDAFRISLGAGRCRIASPFSTWLMRRPASWFASIREYQHDLHIPVWRKSDGPFQGATLNDEDGNLVEWDDRVDGEAGTAARFTTMRSWANGPSGPFIARSLTRAQEGSLLLDTHNVAVVNLCCTTVQLNTEDAAVGVSLILNGDGTATADSLAEVSKTVNEALEQELLTNKKNEGQRASQAKWTPDADTLFNVADPTMLGTTDINLRGTVVSVRTAVKVQTGGA